MFKAISLNFRIQNESNKSLEESKRILKKRLNRSSEIYTLL